MKKITCLFLTVALLLGCISTLISCADNAHEHTYSSDWTYSDESHWKEATCGHDEKTSLGTHSFDTGVIADGTNTVYTCEVCGYKKTEAHTHDYGEWTVKNPATIFEAGEEERACKFVDCTATEKREIAKIEIAQIFVETYPTKLNYTDGESFDSTGIIVKAIGADGSLTDITELVTYDKTALAEADTKLTVSYEGKTAEIRISVTKPNTNAHTHTYEGEWTVSAPATIFADGQKYRVCSFDGCDEKELETIPKIEVTSIEIQTAPEKLNYVSGESFDATGIKVLANGADGSKTDITALVTYDKTSLSYTDTAVVATWGGKSCEIEISVLRVYSVSETLTEVKDGETILVEGIFVGIGDEGSGYVKEMLLKDPDNDNLISIIGVAYGTFPNYGYTKGDKVRLEATLAREVHDASVSNSQNKNFLEFTENNPENISDTILSHGNQITYKLDSVVEISSWSEMKEYFTADNVQAYTYIHFTGTVYFNTYKKAGDGILLHRFSYNSSASGLTAAKPDGERAVGFRQNVIETNTPTVMNSKFAEAFGTTTWPGKKTTVDFYAVLTATNDVNYQLTILDATWIKNNGMQDIKIENQQDIVKEVAEAYYRQGAQIHYDQSWRSENFSPEDATSQNQLNLDCSSYVYNIYYEAFGHSILGVPLTTKSANTANYTAYAKENLGVSPDVIGYWETADYTTEEEQKALLSYVESLLQVGDVIVYRHGKNASSLSGHTVIYIGDGQFLHSTGTKCTYDTNTPENSVDKASSTEYKYGTVGKLATSELFTNTSSSRYLFKNTSSDKMFSFCLIRPLALGLTPTEKTENRAKIPGVVMEKTVSAGLNAAVSKGETITYTLSLENISSNTYIGIDFEEILSDCVEFVSGHAGLTLNGERLTMKVNLEPGENVMISWTVRVKADAENGARIESKNTSFGGVSIMPTENYVSAYTSEQLLSVAAKAREIAAASGSYSDPIELAKAIYRDALGTELFANSQTAEELISDALTLRFVTGTTFMVNSESQYADMLIEKLCLGRSMSGSLPNNIRIVEADLQIGDLLFCQWPSGYRLFVYLDNNEFVSIDTLTKTASVIRGGELEYALSSSTYTLQNLYNSFRSYQKCVVVRPSVAK